MKPQPFQTKFLAAFLVLFVCLNAGGAVCVAYCRSVVLAAMDDHCPLAKEERHCDKAEAPSDGDQTALAAGVTDCCPMIVSFIPGTLEPKQNFSVATFAVLPSTFSATPFVRTRRSRLPNISAYRGPPKDERVLHITNRVLRI